MIGFGTSLDVSSWSPTPPLPPQLKDLYKAYLEEQMERTGGFSEALDQDAKDLQSILNLTTRDAQVRGFFVWGGVCRPKA